MSIEKRRATETAFLLQIFLSAYSKFKENILFFDNSGASLEVLINKHLLVRQVKSFLYIDVTIDKHGLGQQEIKLRREENHWQEFLTTTADMKWRIVLWSKCDRSKEDLQRYPEQTSSPTRDTS